MENNKINAAIQLLPLSNNIDKYKIIDEAISLIHKSGLKYVVCPFETVVEGTYDEIFDLVNKIRTTTLNNGCEELLINIKINLLQCIFHLYITSNDIFPFS